MLLLAGSGAAALGHQFLWTRRLTDLLGATSASNLRVLSGFFLGLALGAAAAAWALPRLRCPWRFFALAEVGTAFLSLPILYLAEWTPWVWSAVGSARLSDGWGSAIRLALSYFLVAPPAFLIGTTVPLVVAAVCPGQTDAAERGVWLYASTTLGGVAGLALVVGCGIQILGLQGAMLFTMGLNVAIAGICLIRHFRTRDEFPLATVRAGSFAAGSPPAPFRWMLVAAFCSGAGIMAFEVLGLRLLTLSALLSFYHPVAILACVILVLAVAAGTVSWFHRRFGGAPGVLPVALAGTGLLAALVPILFLRQVVGGGNFHYATHFGEFVGRLFALTLASLGPALFCAGSIFPLCVIGCGGPAFGRSLGGCLAINGIGGLLGAEITLRLVLPTFGVHAAFGWVACLYSGLALGFGIRFKSRSRLMLPFILISLVLTAWVSIRVLPKLPVFAKADYRAIEVNCGYEGTLAVVERDQLGRAMIFDNQYVLGASGAAPDLERQTHIPLLLHANPERIAFLGLGTGITASGALRHGPVKSITAVELSPLVARAASRHFGEFNRDFCARSNVSVVVEDARAHLAVSSDSYDVIVGDLFTPWRPGDASLCELELFQAARAALRTGGVYCQWLPMHQLTPQQFEVIARTFQRVFPELSLFRNHFKPAGMPLALIGFKDRRLDWTVVSQRCANEFQRGRLADPLCRHPEGLAMLYLGQYRAPAALTGEMNTRKNLWLELDAGRKWILGRKEEYYAGAGKAWLQLLQTQAARAQESVDLPASLRPGPGIGLRISDYEIARDQDPSIAPQMYEQWVARLPISLGAYAGADWSLWPGSQPPCTAAKP